LTVLVEVEEHPRAACLTELLQGIAQLPLGPRLAGPVAAEPCGHDADEDVARRRLAVDHRLRRRADVRDDVVLPGERAEKDLRAIALGPIDPLDDLVEDLAFRGAVAGR
jgi:hypothetical protein